MHDGLESLETGHQSAEDFQSAEDIPAAADAGASNNVPVRRSERLQAIKREDGAAAAEPNEDDNSSSRPEHMQRLWEDICAKIAIWNAPIAGRSVSPDLRRQRAAQDVGPIRPSTNRGRGRPSHYDRAGQQRAAKRNECRINQLERGLKTLSDQYQALQEEYQKMRANHTAMAVISRRFSDDSRRFQEKIDQLSTVKIFLEDRIDDQKDRLKEEAFKIKELQDKVADQQQKISQVSISLKETRDKLEDSTSYALAKDARIKAIEHAIKSIKSNLAWGKFQGDSQELDEVFEEVFQLL